MRSKDDQGRPHGMIPETRREEMGSELQAEGAARAKGQRWLLCLRSMAEVV